MKLSDGSAQESDFCDVVAVGPDAQDYFDIGDVVLRPNPADVEWTDEEDNNQLYLISRVADIKAKVKNVSD